jgi:RNA polymerase sigma factor (sigma-70 family)
VGKRRSRQEGPSSAGRRSFSTSSGVHRPSRVLDVGDRPRPDGWAAKRPAPHSAIRSGLNDDQRGLAMRYLPMAQSLANAFSLRQNVEREELRSTAYMALVEAARTFDPVRKVNFATFARHRIRGALRDYARFLLSENWRGKEALRPSFQSLFRRVEDHGRVLGIRSEIPAGTAIESMESLEAWLRCLPRTHAATCRLIYLGGKTQEEVAQLLGLSRGYVSRMHTESLSFLIDKVDDRRGREEHPRAEKTE